MLYRLALDVGSTSLGWCVLATADDGGMMSPVRLIDLGVRIFSDGREEKSKEPLSVGRRKARGMRRTLDRRDLRQKQLLALLIDAGLMPSDEAARKELERLDPYECRAKAIAEQLSLHHLGRALFHINQRRGFKSNRKTDKRENDSGAMKAAIKDLDQRLLLSDSRTLGVYLFRQKIRRVKTTQIKNKNHYNFYPDRAMYEKEVAEILQTQKAFYPDILSDERCEAIQRIIFYQRPLKPQPVGKCALEVEELRGRLASPLVQRFRILQEVNNLEIVRIQGDEPVLTPQHKRQIIALLEQSKKKSFAQIRKALKIADCRFNLETEARKELKGDCTASLLSQPDYFGARWSGFSADEQEDIVDLIFETENEQELIDILRARWGVTPEQAIKIAEAPLEDGYGRVSKKAIEKMLPFLEQGLTYDKAAKEAGYHHSDQRTGEIFDRLPYYGEILQRYVIGGTTAQADKDFPEKYYGKINNPSVHIALNQIRKLVNEIIATYGKPDEIVIELARDLTQSNEDIKADQAKNKKDNDRIDQELEKLGVKQNAKNRMQFKLWEDLAKDPIRRCCPFTGKQIAEHQIFSGEFEVEHLLPFSKSFNDKRANKVLACRDANRRKGNQTPYEAFAHTAEWPDICARIETLPTNKQWRFHEEAWQIAKGKEGEDIIARQLNDTRYMARMARLYLAAVFDNERGKNRVWAIPGQMTALLRKKWGLNDLLGEEDGAKDRTDHRHHAIDAVVIGCSDRGMLQRLSKNAEQIASRHDLWEKRRKLVMDFAPPFEEFVEQVRHKIEHMVVSHKPDHGNASKAIAAPRPYTVAALHKETAYGLIASKDKGKVIVATRKPLASLEEEKHINEIGDRCIREKVLAAVKGVKPKSLEWKQALADFSERENIRRVRVHIERSADTLVGIAQAKDRGPEKTRGEIYKYYATGGNYCAEIYCPDKDKLAGKWQCEIISNYDAHQKGFIPQWRKDHPTAKLIMRLQIDDMVAYEENGERKITRVKKMSSGMIYLRDHRIAQEEGNKLSWAASATQLQIKKARKIFVDTMGRVKDPLHQTPRQAADDAA